MCINWLKDRKIPGPDIVGSIDADSLYALLRAQFPNIPLLLPDNYYLLATLESFNEYLKYDQTDKYLYTGDNPSGGYDCDAYAARLHGNLSIPKWTNIPKGTIWLSEPAHAVNIFVDANLDVYYVEPQNDSLYLVNNKKDWVPYIMWMA